MEKPKADPRRRFRQRVVRFLLRRTFSASTFRKPPYQPAQIGRHQQRGTREFDARWERIAETIAAYDGRSLIDIGCAEGWLVRRAATELGCFAIGVDAAERIIVGEAARLHDGIERMALMKASLAARDIRALPRSDVVVCLSVVHHVLRREGMPAAQEFVRALASRAEKLLIFEMGTSDESRYSWAAALPSMPEGQEQFVKAFLEACGLTNVRVIGVTERYPGANRFLFSAEPIAK